MHVLTRYGFGPGSFQQIRIMSINPEYKNMGTCVIFSFDHVLKRNSERLYEEEL